MKEVYHQASTTNYCGTKFLGHEKLTSQTVDRRRTHFEIPSIFIFSHDTLFYGSVL